MHMHEYDMLLSILHVFTQIALIIHDTPKLVTNSISYIFAFDITWIFMAILTFMLCIWSAYTAIIVIPKYDQQTNNN